MVKVSKPRGRLDRLWTPAELDVIERFAQAIVGGEYPTLKAAIGPCQAALARVRLNGNRTALAVAVQLDARVLALGRQLRLPAWTPEEDRLARDFARAVVAGRYRRVSQAIPDFQRELARTGLPARHTTTSISTRLYRLTHALGRRVCQQRWNEAEVGIARQFGQAFAQGKYRHSGAAVADCRRALAAVGRAAGYSHTSIRNRILRHAHQAGLPLWAKAWKPKETRILTRYAQALARGEYSTARQASDACQQELGASSQLPGRTFPAVRFQLMSRARADGWHREIRRPRLTADERRIIDRYARRIAAGRITPATAALRPCRRELARLRLPASRTACTVVRLLRARAHAFGLPPVRRLWSDPELLLVQRHARALGAGEYPTIAAAARACQTAMTRAGLAQSLSLRKLADKIRQHAPGWRPRSVR